MLLHKDVVEVVFKNHSIHTYYIEIKYHDKDEDVKSIELSSSDYSNLKPLAEELYSYASDKEIFSTVIPKDLKASEEDEVVSGLVVDGDLNKVLPLKQRIKDAMCWKYIRTFNFVNGGVCILLYSVLERNKMEYIKTMFLMMFKVSLFVLAIYFITYVILKSQKYSAREINAIFGRHTWAIYGIAIAVLRHLNIIACINNLTHRY